MLDDLERRKLLDRTVIVITSDHGMEFDENGLGFTGHGTAYSELQLHTPLLLRWPGKSAGRVTRRTSHNDLAPTLLTGVFGCSNPPSDYASGHSLFSDAEWTWLIGASHLDFALIEPERVTIIRPNGYEVRDKDYRLGPHRAVRERASGFGGELGRGPCPYRDRSPRSRLLPRRREPGDVARVPSVLRAGRRGIWDIAPFHRDG